MANDGTSAVQIQIPQQLISDTIRAEIVRQIPNKEEFAASIIRLALSEKPKDNYGYDRDRGPTIFQQAITNMINEEAKKVFAAWIEKHREDIRAALVTEMTRSKAARVKAIAEAICDDLMKYRVSATLVAKEE